MLQGFKGYYCHYDYTITSFTTAEQISFLENKTINVKQM